MTRARYIPAATAGYPLPSMPIESAWHDNLCVVLCCHNHSSLKSASAVAVFTASLLSESGTSVTLEHFSTWEISADGLRKWTAEVLEPGARMALAGQLPVSGNDHVRRAEAPFDVFLQADLLLHGNERTPAYCPRLKLSSVIAAGGAVRGRAVPVCGRGQCWPCDGRIPYQ